MRKFKKDPFFREIRNAGVAPLCTWVPPPPPPGHEAVLSRLRCAIRRTRLIARGILTEYLQ